MDNEYKNEDRKESLKSSDEQKAGEETATEEGEKTFTCSICGNTKTEKVSTTDHQHMEIRNQKNPTCKEAG